MTGITEGYLTRHYQGIRGARDAAILDIAQDHALYHLHRVGLFDRFGFLRDLSEQELVWCACNLRDNYAVTQALATISDWISPDQ